ncbi:hypothetical protein P154DRAFT_612072 [Amniculicola lignicola CBS 123094]|uniref:Uncharacterized protein n=1 Tax=Amniculicola lignicola CBS 123094 TaxID=1392246 RepID=A0A6A5W4V8_9PLEO|nr:hypothetical protein P154DRAFT_612072 [Amniculicola lignicola CBS 123094]
MQSDVSMLRYEPLFIWLKPVTLQEQARDRPVKRGIQAPENRCPLPRARPRHIGHFSRAEPRARSMSTCPSRNPIREDRKVCHPTWCAHEFTIDKGLRASQQKSQVGLLKTAKRWILGAREVDGLKSQPQLGLSALIAWVQIVCTIPAESNSRPQKGSMGLVEILWLVKGYMSINPVSKQKPTFSPWLNSALLPMLNQVGRQ